MSTSHSPSEQPAAALSAPERTLLARLAARLELEATQCGAGPDCLAGASLLRRLAGSPASESVGLVPIADDLRSVFIDGIGEVPLCDHTCARFATPEAAATARHLASTAGSSHGL